MTTEPTPAAAAAPAPAPAAPVDVRKLPKAEYENLRAKLTGRRSGWRA